MDLQTDVCRDAYGENRLEVECCGGVEGKEGRWSRETSMFHSV